MATAYLLCGSTGAGKSTRAREIAIEERAQVFSIDEWMQNLFWMDAAPEADFTWAIERVRRCETQIWRMAECLLQNDISVVFDLGFSKKEQRDRWRNLIKAAGAVDKLIYLDLPMEARWKRVRARNLEKSGTFQFEVTEETFRWMEAYFEAPGDEELTS